MTDFNVHEVKSGADSAAFIERKVRKTNNKYTTQDIFFGENKAPTGSYIQSYGYKNGNIGSLASTKEEIYYPSGITQTEFSREYVNYDNHPVIQEASITNYNEHGRITDKTMEEYLQDEVHRGSEEYEYYPDGTLKKETHSGHKIADLRCYGIENGKTIYNEDGTKSYENYFLDKDENGFYEKAGEKYYDEEGNIKTNLEYSDDNQDGILDRCYEFTYNPDGSVLSTTSYIYDESGNLVDAIKQFSTKTPEQNEENKGIFAFLKGIFGNS